MVYFLAVGGALANALTTIFQRLGLKDAPAEHSLRFSLIAYAMRRRSGSSAACSLSPGSSSRPPHCTSGG
jgi:hypothetical protein